MALVATPYYRPEVYDRPLNGETLILSAVRPIMVVTEHPAWVNKPRRTTIDASAVVMQASAERSQRTHANPHEIARQALHLKMHTQQHTQGNRRDRLEWADMLTMATRDDTELLIPLEQIRTLAALASRWSGNSWHNGCTHQDRAGWGRTPRYTVRDSQIAPTGKWDRTPITGPYLETKTTSQLWPYQGGVLTKPCRVCGFHWGSDRLVEPLPEDAASEIAALFPGKALAPHPFTMIEPSPLVYPVKEEDDLSWFPVAPDGVIVTARASAVVWESADRARWFRFDLALRKRETWGGKYGHAGTEGHYLFNSVPLADMIRVARGWLAA